MKAITRQIQLFLVPEDEREISFAVQKLRPNVRFLDGNVWEGSQPRLAPSIDACRARQAYLWDQDLVSPLPTLPRKDGRLEGPISGVVVQLDRSFIEGNVLRAGSVAAGTGLKSEELELAMRGFIADVWKVVKLATPGTLDAINPVSGDILTPAVKEFRAGRHAVAWLAQEDGRFFRARSTLNYFSPTLP